MKKTVLLKLILWFSIVVCFQNLSAQNFSTDLENVFTQQQLMGISVVTVCEDVVNNNLNFGLRDFARNLPINENTLYRIASISKSVTSIALMILFEEGKFSLDDDISNILGFTVRNPNFPNTPITVRMLLSHQSTIVDGSGYFDFLSATSAQNPPPALSELLQPNGSFYTNDIWLNEPVGEYFTYCNLNFAIIGTLIEKLSNQRFDVFCKERIFTPLQIDASFNIQDLQDIDNVAVLYRKQSGSWTPQVDNYQGIMPPPRNLDDYVIGTNGAIFAPQGGLRISATNLAKIMILLMKGGTYNNVQILQPQTIELMQTPEYEYNGSNGENYYGLFCSWGLGLHLITNSQQGDLIYNNLTMKGHAGEAYGLISDMYYNEDENVGFVFITNGAAADFEMGEYSSFYRTEELVFTTIYNNVFEEYLSNNELNTSSNFNFTISPNPASEFVTIVSNNFCSNIFCEISNISGQVVKKFAVSSSNFNYDISDLPSGEYIFSFQNEKETFLKKMIIIAN